MKHTSNRQEDIEEFGLDHSPWIEQTEANIWLQLTVDTYVIDILVMMLSKIKSYNYIYDTINPSLTWVAPALICCRRIAQNHKLGQEWFD
jgi:hypothetical protein